MTISVVQRQKCGGSIPVLGGRGPGQDSVADWGHVCRRNGVVFATSSRFFGTMRVIPRILNGDSLVLVMQVVQRRRMKRDERRPLNDSIV